MNFDEDSLLEKPLRKLKEMINATEKANLEGDKAQEALNYALKRSFVYKYNEIKRTLLQEFIAECEYNAMKLITEYCNKKMTEYENETIVYAQSLKEFYDKLDIAFVEEQSKSLQKAKENNNASREGIQYVINKITIDYLNEVIEKIKETIDEAEKMQEVIEPLLTKKQYLGIVTLVPVKKKQLQIKPLVNKDNLPEETIDTLTYKKLNLKKAKDWALSNPEQSLFEIKEKDYYLKIISKVR